MPSKEERKAMRKSQQEMVLTRMDEVVVGLAGEYVPQAGKPMDIVVDRLEELLAMAKAGRLHCFVAAYDTPDGVHYDVVGAALGFDMLGGLDMAKSRVKKMMEQ